MARIAVPLAPDFEDEELESPRATLREHEHDVHVLSDDVEQELVGKRTRVRTTADRSIDEVAVDDYDAVLIPGGYSPDKLRTDDRMVRFVRDAFRAGKPIAAICHAGSLLIEAGVVDGRTVTSWPSIRTDLVNAGADWVDEEVVVDGNLITSREPDDIPAFTKALLDALGDLHPAEDVA